MPFTSRPYRALIRLGVGLAPVLSFGSPKLRAAIAGRRGVTGRLAAWAGAHRDPRRPLLWMHAPSVGEGLQAEAVLRRLRTAHPEWQVAFTHFSPSAESLAKRLPVEIADYLPWDRSADVAVALDALRPAALIFSKLDLWPELATRAAGRGVAVGMIAATVTPASRRLSLPVRALLRPGYQAVAGAGAISPGDGERLVRLGVPPERIEITGDPRFDSALERVRAMAPDDSLRALTAGALTLVAGSTWPADEDRLLKAFRMVRIAHPTARLIVVPHEPTMAHLRRLDAAAGGLGLTPPVRLSAGGQPSSFMVVDSVGMLASLYLGATLAYVGGGFGRAGLHSVLEPAACGVPVLFGPRWKNSREAGLLLDSGAARRVTDDLAARWSEFLADAGRCGEAGRRGLEVIEAGLGAAARSASLVERLMERGGSTAR